MLLMGGRPEGLPRVLVVAEVGLFWKDWRRPKTPLSHFSTYGRGQFQFGLESGPMKYRPRQKGSCTRAISLPRVVEIRSGRVTGLRQTPEEKDTPTREYGAVAKVSILGEGDTIRWPF